MVSETVILRPAKEEDLEALVRLLQRSWLVTWAPELPFDAVRAFANFDPAKAHAEAEWREFVVAARNDSLVGMVQVEGDRITHIHVDPAHWNGGVGSALLNAAEQKIAQSHVVARLEVRGFNIRAKPSTNVVDGLKQVVIPAWNVEALSRMWGWSEFFAEGQTGEPRGYRGFRPKPTITRVGEP